jgi:NAD(P)-dependent dehydrogenase (short-subunit alcohol dehydrogenase family)
METKRRMEDKVAIVTGGGSVASGIGNGRATSILFARAGAKVLVVDMNLSAAEETQKAIQQEGGTSEVFVADVSQAKDCEAIVKKTMDLWGKLDVLDNNVGISGRGNVVEFSVEAWDRMMAVNVKSVMLMGKYAIPQMKASGGGSIINISSISAIRPRGLTAYSTSKGAVIALTQAMAIDHAQDGIRVNCILPGPVYTPMVYTKGMTEEDREQRRKASPLGTEGTGWDIGNAALFLASDEARWITGIALIVDGGTTLASPPRKAGYE